MTLTPEDVLRLRIAHEKKQPAFQNNLALRLTRAQESAVVMATDALASLSAPYLFDVIEAHIEGRPDVNPEALERFADRLRRKAWDIERRKTR